MLKVGYQVSAFYTSTAKWSPAVNCAVFLKPASTEHHPSGAKLAFLPCLQSSDATQLTQIQNVHEFFSQQ